MAVHRPDRSRGNGDVAAARSKRRSNRGQGHTEPWIRLNVGADASGRAVVSYMAAPELRAGPWENPMSGISGGALETWSMVEL